MNHFPNCCDHGEELDTFLKSQLAQAGIKVHDSIVNLCSEVGTSITGTLGPWMFRRGDCHWIAEGPGMPMEIADVIFQDKPEEICAGGLHPSTNPRHAFMGFCCPVYHVHTQEALTYFANKIRGIIESSKPTS